MVPVEVCQVTATFEVFLTSAVNCSVPAEATDAGDGVRLIFRCPECLGRVRLRAASEEKETVAHGEHYSKNPGCSLGSAFAGEKKPHPKPLN